MLQNNWTKKCVEISAFLYCTEIARLIWLDSYNQSWKYLFRFGYVTSKIHGNIANLNKYLPTLVIWIKSYQSHRKIIPWVMFRSKCLVKLLFWPFVNRKYLHCISLPSYIKGQCRSLFKYFDRNITDRLIYAIRLIWFYSYDTGILYYKEK